MFLDSGVNRPLKTSFVFFLHKSTTQNLICFELILRQYLHFSILIKWSSVVLFSANITQYYTILFFLILSNWINCLLICQCPQSEVPTLNMYGYSSHIFHELIAEVPISSEVRWRKWGQTKDKVCVGWNWTAEMKGGQWSRLWGRQYFCTLAALVFTSILLWSWEENPLIPLKSDEDQFIKPSG